MSAEIVQVLDQAEPYVTAALAAYGGAVLSRVEGMTADATASLGRQILSVIWRRSDQRRQAGLLEAAQEAAQDQADADASAALRQQIKMALREDADLLRDIAGLLPPSAPVTVTASGPRSIAAQSISGVATTGDRAEINT
ncbi:hypothetical protein [Streptomyces brevispora]|uniref:hypothetical protein n=1 Tax=Streptomyces brevispora TaxID=887462 RepID=UPI0035E36E83